MTDLRGWSLSEQHLLPDAVVAFVDGELSTTARERAAAHLVHCPYCAAEIAAQRQARAAVRAADAPCTPAGLMAALRAIPNEVELPGVPDELAVTDDGQLVAVQRRGRPGGGAPFGSGPALGSSTRLGEGPTVLGRGRRTAQGAGVVVSGLVLGALAFVAPSGSANDAQTEQNSRAGEPLPVVAGEPLRSTTPTAPSATLPTPEPVLSTSMTPAP